MRRDDVKIGDVIEVISSGLRITAKVATVDFYDEDGWQIEMEDVGGNHTYRSWKQRHDGGRITKINGKDVPDVYCKDCIDSDSNRWSHSCKACSMYSNFKKPRTTSAQRKAML